MEEIKEVETDAVTSRRLVSEDRPLSSRRRPLIRPHTQTDSSLRPHTNPTFWPKTSSSCQFLTLTKGSPHLDSVTCTADLNFREQKIVFHQVAIHPHRLCFSGSLWVRWPVSCQPSTSLGIGSLHPCFIHLLKLYWKRFTSCPGRTAQVVAASSYTTEGCRLDFQMGHIPTWWVLSPGQLCTGGNQQMFLPLYLSLPLSLKSVRISSCEDLKIKLLPWSPFITKPPQASFAALDMMHPLFL